MAKKKSTKKKPKKAVREKGLYIPLSFEKVVEALLHTKPKINEARSQEEKAN